jgi:UPF0716 protein FxsA
VGIRFLLFGAFPLLELWLLLKLGALLGVFAVLCIVVASVFVGIRVLQVAGWRTLTGSRWRMQRGESPAPELANGFLLAISGALFLLPGLISDFLGLLLLIAPVRRYVAARFRPNRAAAAGHRPDQPVVIEGEYRREP